MITHTRSERPQFGGASHDWSCRCKNCGVRMIRAWNSVDICRKKRGRFQLQRFEYVDTRASVAWFTLSSHNQSWPFNVVTLLFIFHLTWFAFLPLKPVHMLCTKSTGTRKRETNTRYERRLKKEEKKIHYEKNGVKTWTTGIFVSFAFDLFEWFWSNSIDHWWCVSDFNWSMIMRSSHMIIVQLQLNALENEKTHTNQQWENWNRFSKGISFQFLTFKCCLTRLNHKKFLTKRREIKFNLIEHTISTADPFLSLLIVTDLFLSWFFALLFFFLWTKFVSSHITFNK